MFHWVMQNYYLHSADADLRHSKNRSMGLEGFNSFFLQLMGTGDSQQSHLEQLTQSNIQEVQKSLAELRCHKVTLPAYQRVHQIKKTWVSFSELPSKKYNFYSNTPTAFPDYSGKKSTVGMYGPQSNDTGSWQSATCALNNVMIHLCSH